MKIRRISDGEILLRNADDGTFTFEWQYESMPTTFYRYSYGRLMDTGDFEVVQ